MKYEFKEGKSEDPGAEKEDKNNGQQEGGDKESVYSVSAPILCAVAEPRSQIISHPKPTYFCTLQKYM